MYRAYLQRVKLEFVPRSLNTNRTNRHFCTVMPEDASVYSLLFPHQNLGLPKLETLKMAQDQ